MTSKKLYTNFDSSYFQEAALSIAHYRGLSASSKTVLEEVSRIKQMITPAVELVATDAGNVIALFLIQALYLNSYINVSIQFYSILRTEDA